MKKSEIVLGGFYSNSPGCVYCELRKVIEETGPKGMYSQKDCDCVKYKVVSGRRNGYTAIMTRARFAAWAKRRMDNGFDYMPQKRG